MKINSPVLLSAVIFLICGCSLMPKSEPEPRVYNFTTPILLDGTTSNPIITHVYTADPTARVFNGRIYLYASHDLDDQEDYEMVDYHIFSSDDLVNWVDHGIALHVDDFTWNVDSLYAPDCVYDDASDAYYLFFPNGGSDIGVAVSDNPDGPFEDAIGGTLITRSFPGAADVEWVFDPGVFIDDDGQAYLYFGGGMPNTGDNARVVRLNDDLISIMDNTATTIVAPDFFEASFMFKRNDIYYFSYSTNWENGHGIRIDYMTSDNPMTGFVHKGVVIENPPYNQGNNNHHSIVEYQGEYYVFYHNRKLALERGIDGGFQRSVSLDTLSFDEDGDIITVELTDGTTSQLKNVDGLSRIEAELIAAQDGVKVEAIYSGGEKTGSCLKRVNHGDWTAVSQVEFSSEVSTFTARVLPGSNAGEIEVWIDGGEENGGTLLGTCDVAEGAAAWTDVSCDITPVSGIHNLYLIFKNEEEKNGLFKVDYYLFE